MSNVWTVWKTPVRTIRIVAAKWYFGVVGTTALMDSLLTFWEQHRDDAPSPELAAPTAETSVATATHTDHTQQYYMITRRLISLIKSFVDSQRFPNCFNVPNLERSELLWRYANEFNLSVLGKSSVSPDELARMEAVGLYAPWNSEDGE